MPDFVFQQDNDPKHKSTRVKEYIDDRNIKTMSWPSQSPDMNPIENLWHDLKTVVASKTQKNIKQLKEIIVAEWNLIDKNICKNLVASMHQRSYDLWEPKDIILSISKKNIPFFVPLKKFKTGFK